MVTHSSTLAWRIPWREEPGRLQSMGSQSQTRLSNFTSLTLSIFNRILLDLEINASPNSERKRLKWNSIVLPCTLWISTRHYMGEELSIQCPLLFAREMIQFSSVQSLSCVRLFVTPWTVAYQAPLSMGFSRQEY